MTPVRAYAPYVLSLLRIMAGLLFLQNGTMKILAFPAPFDGGGPALLSLLGVAGLIELVSGTLITLGLFTKLAAFVASGEMAFAYFIDHAPHSFFPILNRGDLAVLYCFVFLYLAVEGGGPWSLDALLRGKPAVT